MHNHRIHFLTSTSRDPLQASRLHLGSSEREMLCQGSRPALFDTGLMHGPERPEILPFIATIEVRYNGAWMPEAKGSSIWWLKRELDSISQCYRRVRVVAPWGEELDLNGRQS